MGGQTPSAKLLPNYSFDVITHLNVVMYMKVYTMFGSSSSSPQDCTFIVASTNLIKVVLMVICLQGSTGAILANGRGGRETTL